MDRPTGKPAEDAGADTITVHRRSRLTPLALWLVVGVLALAVAAGGWLWWREHSLTVQARAAAASVATALSAGELPPAVDVPDRSEAQLELTKAVGGMEPMRHEVAVLAVVRSGDEAVATFEHRWSDAIPSHTWAYQTQLSLVRGDQGWQGRWRADVLAPDLVAGERLQAVRLPAPRGDILGGDGGAIVTSRPVVRVGIDKTKVDAAQAATSARELATALDVEVDDYVAAVRAAGPRAFVEAIVLREDAPQVATLTGVLNRIPGSLRVADSLPLAPTASFARPILGTIGQASAEGVAASEGKVRVGDVVGLSGLQAARDVQLRGVPGLQVRIADENDKTRTLIEVAPQAGTDVQVSLNEGVQLAAESALAEIGPASALVAVRPSDGHLLAVASGPGSQGQSTATLGRYAPGSTFKVVTTLALLRAGVTPTSELDCPTGLTVDGRDFRNHTGYPAEHTGRIDLRQALAQSCNTAFIGARSKLAEGALADAAAALGMTADPRLGVPATMGSVPPPASKVEAAADLIGQGTVTASPLAMATVVASIGRGSVVHPTLVIGEAPSAAGASDAPATTSPSTIPSDSTISSASPAPSTPAPPTDPLTAAEADTLRELMRGVVTGGTAQALSGLPGGRVMAKTGTAEYGTDQPPRTHAWMIAIQGDLAVAVFVEDGAGGATTAGPVLVDFLTALAS